MRAVPLFYGNRNDRKSNLLSPYKSSSKNENYRHFLPCFTVNWKLNARQSCTESNSFQLCRYPCGSCVAPRPSYTAGRGAGSCCALGLGISSFLCTPISPICQPRHRREIRRGHSCRSNSHRGLQWVGELYSITPSKQTALPGLVHSLGKNIFNIVSGHCLDFRSAFLRR